MALLDTGYIDIVNLYQQDTFGGEIQMDDGPGDLRRNKLLWRLLKTKMSEKVGYYRRP